MKDRILNFLDVETTGFQREFAQIIEVAVIKVKNDQVIDTFETFLRPERPPHYFVQKLTGIRPAMLEHAPEFKEIAEELHGYLHDGTLVAHHAQFDVGFLRKEFARQDMNIKFPFACTRRLSSLLYPEHRKHSLDSIIRRYEININIKDRHRAMGDTEAMYEFFKFAQATIQSDIFDRALQSTICS